MSHPFSPALNRRQKILRGLYHFFWYSLAALVIFIAVVISLVRIFLPDIGVYRSDLEAFAGQAMGRAIQVESLNAKLDGLTPTFICEGVHLFDAQNQHELVRFAEARIGFDLLRSIWHAKPIFKSIAVSGLDLAIIRHSNGTLSVQGIEIDQLEKTLNAQAIGNTTESNELSDWLFERSHLSILNSRVIWRDDKRSGKTIQFDNVNFKVRNDGKRHQLNGQVKLPAELGEELVMAVDFTGNILVPSEWEGTFFAQGRHVKAKHWDVKPSFLNVSLQDGEMDLQLWGGWAAQSFTSLSGYLTVNDVQLAIKGNTNPFALKLLSGMFDWRRQQNGWQLHVDNFHYQQADTLWPETNFSAAYQAGEHPVLQLQASLLRLGDVKSLAGNSGLLTSEMASGLNKIKPQGELHDLHLTLHLDNDKASGMQIRTQFTDLSAKPWENVPGFSGVSGSVWMDDQYGVMQLEGSNAALDFNGLFRAPLKLTQLRGDITWWRDEQSYYIRTPQLLASNNDIQTQSSLYLVVPRNGQSAFLDLQSHFQDGNVANAGQFYPVRIMDEDLVNWLDQGLVQGHIDEGGVVVRGRLADFPYQNHNGKFEVKFTGKDIELNYKKGWPHITHLQLDGEFSGTDTRLYSPAANLYDSKLHDIDVRIADFSNPVLDVKGQYQGSTQDAVQFLVNSPIAPQAKDFYTDTRFEGRNTATLQLQVPLADDMEDEFPLTYSGKVTFIESGLSTFRGMLEVSKLNGDLEYSTQGVSGKGIRAQVLGGKTEVFVFTHPIEASQQIKIGMKGELDVGATLKRLQLPVADEVKGRTHWAGLLSFGYRAAGRNVPGSFNFDSDMQGVRVDLPEPLNKNADESRHFNFNVEFPQDKKFTIAVGLEKLLRAKLQLDSADVKAIRLQRATVNFSDTEPILPVTSAIRISGRLEAFSAATWQHVLADGSNESKGLGFAKLTLPIELDMDHMSVTTGAMFDEESSAKVSAESPKRAPLINGVIRELIVDKMHLGRFEIATERDKDGMRIKHLDFASDDMKIRGSGSWFYRKRQHQTNMLFDLESPDVGNMLHRLGYAGIIRHGKAVAHMQLNWADAPSRFAFSKLDGTLGIVINDGIVDQVEPGAGRLLGLLSLTELPRHLVLNFKEFSKGMSFDEIKGNFDFAAGNAVTENLNIDSPAAVIAIRGRTGFATRDYDLEVIAVPRVTSSLSLVGCLLTGGSTCGWVFFFDRLVGKSIDDSLAKRFTVQGTWEKPEIKEIARKEKPVESTANH